VADMSRAPKRIRSFQDLGCLSIQPATSVYLRVGRIGGFKGSLQRLSE